jgi:cobalt/nickel transport protein
VPFADIEVQYVNRDIDPATRAWTGEPKVKLPHPAFETLSLRADASGNFTIGLPKAGWWGVAALGAGPTTTFKGKNLSQDAVIWVQATDMK